MADFRIDTGFFRHIKTKRLTRALGLDGVVALIKFWAYAAECKHGDDRRYTEEDIELAVDWTGSEGDLVKALVDVGFVDVVADGYAIHEWSVHNGWAATAAKRSEVSRKAGKKKWGVGEESVGETRSERLKAARAIGVHTDKEWNEMVAFFDGVCVKCGAENEQLVKDHITLISNGGSDLISNIQPLCRRCSAAKGPDNTDYRLPAADILQKQMPAAWINDACAKDIHDNLTPATCDVDACGNEKEQASNMGLMPGPSPLPLPSPLPSPLPKIKKHTLCESGGTSKLPADAPIGAQSAKNVVKSFCLEQFEVFWEVFADKRGKDPAWNAWRKIKGLDRSLMAKIIAGAKRYASQRPAIIERKGTPKMAQGWLSDRRWEDEGVVATAEVASPELDAAFARVMEVGNG